jgi:hypothetical protein
MSTYSSSLKRFLKLPEFQDIPRLDLPSASPRYKNFLYVAKRGFDAFLTLSFNTTIVAENDPTIAFLTPLHALRNQSPFLHLSEEMLKAFMYTSPPREWDWRSPYPSFILNLPSGVLKSSKGYSAQSLFVGTAKNIEDWYELTMGCRISFPSLDASLLVTLSETGKTDLCIFAIYSDGGYSFINHDWKRLLACAYGLDDGDSPADELKAVLPDLHHFDNEELTSAICRVVLNTMLALETQKHLLTDEPVAHRAFRGFGPDSGKCFHLRWVGKDFKRRLSTVGTGEGGSRSPHWRRGHWHTVLYGIGKTLKRLNWFEPVFVGGEEGSL